MSLANAYYHLEKYEKAIFIYKKLLECLNMEYIFGEYVEHMQMIIMRNLSVVYIAIKKYNEAMLLNSESLKLAKKNNDGREVHVILSDRACIILKQVEDGECDSSDKCLAKKYLRQSYLLAAARKDERMSEVLKAVYSKKFGENL